jgi:hypothetical protein
MKPRVSIIGFHPVRLTRSEIVENMIAVCPEGKFDDIFDLSDAEFAENVADLYLIEMRIDHPDSALEPGDLEQAGQVAYLEKFLNDEGTEVLDAPPSNASVRLGFFLHFVIHDEPLSTP